MSNATPLPQNQTPISYEGSGYSVGICSLADLVLLQSLCGGEITGDKEAIDPIIHRFTLNTETTQKLGIRDIIFEPNEEPAIGEPLYLRCRRDNTKTSNSWSLFTYGRPQPERISPDAIVRPVAMMHVNAGNIIAFASALGYRIKSDTVKEGYLFTKGNMTIQMFRQPKSKPKEFEVIDLDPEVESEQSWNVDIRQYPVVSSKETSITEAVDNVLALKLLMKGVARSRKEGCSMKRYAKGQNRIAEQELPDIKDGISICRVGVARGGSQFEVSDGESTWLAELPKRFRNTVWVRRGSHVLVDTTHGSAGSNIKGEITFVLQKDHITQLKKRGEWPAKLDESQTLNAAEEYIVGEEVEASRSDEEEEGSDDSDPGLFKNPNRR
ncbi:hypothetical protein OPQ81_004220 [Rhizoctonia solani]|nr:hypothetical protein OPQ81_004220 [Rhizoctonia solani]